MTLHQLPIVDFQPSMLPSMKVWSLITAPDIIVEFYTLVPAPITQFSPIETFGPMTAVGSTFAEAAIKTSPLILSPLARSPGESFLRLLKWSVCAVK